MLKLQIRPIQKKKSGYYQKRLSQNSSGDTKWKSFSRLHNLEVKDDTYDTGTSSICLNS